MDTSLTDSHHSAARPPSRHERTRGMRRWLPVLSMFKHYNRSLFSQDLSAGLVLTAMMAPVGMGYAEATGLPAIYGLYATIVPLLVYAIVGPSRILVIGPDSALTALIAATVLPLAAGDAIRAASMAAVLAILSGLICILAGLARFGFITDLLSKPIRYGYLNGIALTLLLGQLPKVLGFSVPSGSIVPTASGLMRGMSAGKTNGTACAIGFACLALIFRLQALGTPLARRALCRGRGIPGRCTVRSVRSGANRCRRDTPPGIADVPYSATDAQRILHPLHRCSGYRPGFYRRHECAFEDLCLARQLLR
jgi:MFS superfamily sulfate permease-like transporter